MFEAWVAKGLIQANSDFRMGWPSIVRIIFTLPIRGTPGYKSSPFE